MSCCDACVRPLIAEDRGDDPHSVLPLAAEHGLPGVVAA